MKATFQSLSVGLGAAAEPLVAMTEGRACNLDLVRAVIPQVTDRTARVEFYLLLFRASAKGSDLQSALDACHCVKKANPAECDRILRYIVQAAVDKGEFSRAREAARRMTSPRARGDALNVVVAAERERREARGIKRTEEYRLRETKRQAAALAARGVYIPQPAAAG